MPYLYQMKTTKQPIFWTIWPTRAGSTKLIWSKSRRSRKWQRKNWHRRKMSSLLCHILRRPYRKWKIVKKLILMSIRCKYWKIWPRRRDLCQKMLLKLALKTSNLSKMTIFPVWRAKIQESCSQISQNIWWPAFWTNRAKIHQIQKKSHFGSDWAWNISKPTSLIRWNDISYSWDFSMPQMEKTWWRKAFTDKQYINWKVTIICATRSSWARICTVDF